MKQEQLQAKIMNAMADRGLTPRSRWQFLLNDAVIKTIAGLVSLFGGFAVATMYFMLTDHDWDVFRYLDRSFLEHVLISLPYVWIILFVLFSVVAYYAFRRTRHGYRYSTTRIIATSFIGSIVFGALVVGFGFDHILHNQLLADVPLYEKLTYTKQDIWMYPKQGLLSGIMQGAEDRGNFSLNDAEGHLWNVHMVDDTIIERGVVLVRGSHLKLIGKMLNSNAFQADVIRPWGR